MKKIKSYIIPALMILFFIAVMNSGIILKKPFSRADDVGAFIEAVRNDVSCEKWDKAGKDLGHLKTAWDIVERRVQFSVERNEMNMIDTNLARMEGALSVHDKEFIITELSEMKNHWDELEK